MKILVIGSHNSHYVISHLESLLEIGYEVIFLNTDGHYSSEHESIEVVQLPFRLDNKSNFKYFGYFVLAFLSRWVVKKYKVDLIHAHYVISAGLIATLWKVKSVPTIVSARGSDIYQSKSGFRKFIVNYVMSRADTVHCVSGMIEKTVKDIRPQLLPAKLPIFTQGIVISDYSFKLRSFQKNSLQIVVTRRLEEVYDPITIVRAAYEFRKISKTPLFITFAATGSMQSELECLCQDLGLSSSIKFLGGFNSSDLNSIFMQADYYLSASLHDGVSISLLEALSCGLIPLLSDIESNREVLFDSPRQFFYDCSDVDSLVELLLDVESTPSEGLVMLSKSNRQLVEQRFDRERYLASLDNLYNQFNSGF